MKECTLYFLREREWARICESWLATKLGLLFSLQLRAGTKKKTNKAVSLTVWTRTMSPSFEKLFKLSTISELESGVGGIGGDYVLNRAVLSLVY